jgi:hypothetical protein
MLPERPALDDFCKVPNLKPSFYRPRKVVRGVRPRCWISAAIFASASSLAMESAPTRRPRSTTRMIREISGHLRGDRARRGSASKV